MNFALVRLLEVTRHGLKPYLSLVIAASCCGAVLASSDWPTYLQNSGRNAYVSATLQPCDIEQLWELSSPSAPRPAWYGPAKWDAYSNLKGLHSMRNYDPVFHVTGAGDHIFYGSSLEHCVRCLDAKSGEVVWTTYVNGPVRVTPTYHDNKLYFGSDDGYAYCVSASTGEIEWKFSPSQPGRLIVNDGNYIPLWPIRSGVAIKDNTAYFAASLLPWHPSYLCAVDTKTGRPRGKGRYVREHKQLTLDGPLALSQGAIVAPQGRVSPILFSRQKGDALGALEGGGGAFVVVSGEEVLHGPGNKEGWITRSSVRSRDHLATHKNARGVVVVDDNSYLMTDKAVVALQEGGKSKVWQTPCDDPLSLIGVGDCLFIGGVDYVEAINRKTGEKFWRAEVDGRSFGLAYSNEKLLVSTDIGSVYAFAMQKDRPHASASQNSTADAAVSEPPQPLVKLQDVKDESLVGRWVFQTPHATEDSVSDLAGDQAASVSGDVSFARVGGLQAMELGDNAQVVVASDHTKANLPSRAMSVEVWARVDQPQQWGGLFGAVQDNGSDEHGWVLGYLGSRFAFGLSAEGGSSGLTYLQPAESFEMGSWHHLVGVYDGQEMRLYVDGKLAGKSTAQKGDISYPGKTPFVIGAYRDSNENFPLSGGVHEVRLYDKPLPENEVVANYEALASHFPEPKPATSVAAESTFRVAVGPWLSYENASEATVRWETSEPMPSQLVLIDGQNRRMLGSEAKTKQHEVRLTGLGHNRVYQYEIQAKTPGGTQSTKPYECDTFFNYAKLWSPAQAEGRARGAKSASAAKDVLQQTGVTQGLCIDLDMQSGDLARQLVAQSHLRVVGLVDDAKRAASLRAALSAEGLYGARIAILCFEDGYPDEIGLTSSSANLVVSEGSLERGASKSQHVGQMRKLLAPRGKGVLFASGDNGAEALERKLRTQLRKARIRPASYEISSAKTASESPDGARWAIITAPAPEGAGDWSHAYGRADNSAFGGESLGSAKTNKDLAVQWLGRPGPRYQTDRSGRKPPPLSTAGRIYMQGMYRIVSVDAHNGSVLWSLETPHFERQNIPRDCSNWCADEEYLYTAIRGHCWKINAQTGQPEQFIPVAISGLDHKDFEWGYIASSGDAVIGSAVKSGSSALNYWGGVGWYDGVSGDAVKKVLSDRLFAVSKSDGSHRWNYDGGLILNSTITIAGDKIWLVESRDPDSLASGTRQINSPKLLADLHLVALDGQTGQRLWSEPLNIETPDIACYLAHSDDRLVLVSSNAKKKAYFIYGIQAQDGVPVWRQTAGWGKGTNDHGTHLSRPAIVGDRLVVRPAVLSLATGKIDKEMPVSGCGTYACTTEAMFFRAWSGADFAMWSFDDGSYTKWKRLRPDCWLSTIPADGLLLAPEGGGGCSCGHWLETSMAFIPKVRWEE